MTSPDNAQSRVLNHYRGRFADIRHTLLRQDLPSAQVKALLTELLRALDWPLGFRIFTADRRVLINLRNCLEVAIVNHARVYKFNGETNISKRQLLVQTRLLCDTWLAYPEGSVGPNLNTDLGLIHVPLHRKGSQFFITPAGTVRNLLAFYSDSFSNQALHNHCVALGI
ncbi:hypothetical protein V5O48_018803 [Marasmius crinis-equi]|uniref:GAF domain-containing protein n=1 Tax=Marasmius crinis-equi TaxID=585013 RepID=A0ABR3EK52_9AGAR